jgi:transposase
MRRSPDRSRGLPDDEGSYAAHLEDLDVPDATFACPDLTTFCRLDELGLEVVGQRLEPDRAVLACRVVEPDAWCRRCGCEGAPRDTLIRRLAHEPLGWRPTTLEVTIRRYRCTGCGHVWRQDTSQAAEPRAKLSRRGLRWALEGIVCQHLTVARVAEGLGVAWNTANDAVLAEGKRVLIEDPARFEGVKVLGVDEHVWRHTRRGDKYVTVIIDLTPIREGSGPARLLDMVQGRSKQAFKQWLADRPQAWRDKVQVVAMDGFTGFKTATSTRAWEAPFGRPPTSAATSSTPRGASTSSSGDSCEQFVGGRGGDGDPGRL